VERSAFEKKSYFNLVDIYKKGNVPAIATDSSIPDDEKGENDGNLNFAEAGQSRQ
jgi:hypothetical protein